MSETQGSGRSGIGRIAAAFLFVGLGGGLLYSALRIHELTFDVEDLRGKVSRKQALPTASTAPAPAVDVLPSSTPEGGEVSAEVDRLKKELEALKAALGAQPTQSVAGDGTPVPAYSLAAPSSSGPPPDPLIVAMESMTPEQKEVFKKSVLAVVDEREKEREAKKQEKRKSEIVESLAAKLGLTDTQKDRVQTTVDQAAARITELRKQMTDDNQEQVRNDIRTTMKTADDGIRLLLTAEQATQYDVWKEQVNAKQMFGFGGGGGGKNKGQQNPQR